LSLGEEKGPWGGGLGNLKDWGVECETQFLGGGTVRKGPSKPGRKVKGGVKQTIRTPHLGRSTEKSEGMEIGKITFKGLY